MGGSKMKIVSEREEMIQVYPYLLFQRLTVIETHGKTETIIFKQLLDLDLRPLWLMAILATFDALISVHYIKD